VQAPEQAMQQQVAAPATPQAKPPSAEPGATPASAEPANQPQPSATPETAAPVAPVAGSEHAETKSAAEKPVNTETPSSPAVRPNSPEAAERPQTASAVSDFIQAAHQPTPDGSQLALQTGRDFGQAVAAAAHASQGAAASDALTSAPVPLESLAVEIATRARAGGNRFEIRLDPPELGRIDVRLDIDRSGNVTSRLVVEKAETLDVLRRDAHQLERALQDAGLKTSDNGMQFSLRDQAFADRNDRNGSDNPRILIADPELPAAEGAAVAYGLTLRGGGGIDIRV
jgi:flagellar hook-length control protein FliK